MDRPNPVSTAVLGTVRLGATDDDEKRVLTQIITDGLKADGDRESWLSNQRTLTKLRYGIRKPKTFPWANASNLSIPFIDAAIRKYKPMLMRLVVEPDPIVEFVGEDAESVGSERKAETYYNWLFKIGMNALEPIAYLIDTLCHRGFAFAQVGWEYETEYETRTVSVQQLFPQGLPQDPQAVVQVLAEQYQLSLDDPRIVRSLEKAIAQIQTGAQFIKLAFRRVVKDLPAVWERDPVQVIAPPRTTDYGNAEWIIVQHVLSDRRVKQLEADGLFIPGTANKIRTSREKRPTNTGPNETGMSTSINAEEQLEAERDRIWGSENDDNILVWQVFHWSDIDNDGLMDRVETWIHPKSHTKCACRPYAYPFHRWPLVKFDFEKTSRRWHSPRGISAMLRDLQKEVNQQHNARIDGMTLRNAPMFQIPLLAGFKARNFRCKPGEVVQTPGGARLEPLIQDRGAYPEMVNEENLLRNLGESYIGLFDAAITSPSNQTKARTATEIQAVMQYTSATSTFDTILFQLAMRELHELIWQLWADLGPEEVTFKVLGEDPQSNEAKLITITKGEIAKRYKLIPTGTIANTNRALELANAREAMALYANDMTGFVNPYELRRWHLNLLTYRWARRILNPPEAARNLNVLNQAAEAIQDPALMASLTADKSNPAPTNPPPEEAGTEFPEMGTY